MKHRMRWFIVLLGFTALALAPLVFADGPAGAGPGDPLMVSGDWQTAPANTSLWFYFDYPGNRSSIEAALDANGANGLQLAIFTPAQASAWSQDPTTKPVGLGTRPGASSAAAVHDLFWRGAFGIAGRFFAVVTNSTSSEVRFRLTIAGSDVALRPTVAPTRRLRFANPYATPLPAGSVQGRLVFQQNSGGDLYAVNGDGSHLTRVSNGMDPDWSPDGQQIAFARWDEPAGLYVANADGSSVREVFAGPGLLSPQWSPEGTRLAFIRREAVPPRKTICYYMGMFCFEYPNDTQPWKVGVVQISSGQLSEPRSGKRCFSPTWSFDGHTLAYVDSTFGLMGTDTAGGAEWVLSPQIRDVQSTAWSPDGSRIAFQAKQHDHWEINIVNADGSGLSTVTRADPLAFEIVNNVAPAWSPDGREILFLSDRNGRWEFFAANVDGSNLRQVLKNVTDALPIFYNHSNERVIDWTK